MGEKRDCSAEIEKAGKTGAKVGGAITGTAGAVTGVAVVAVAAAESAVPVALTGVTLAAAGALIGKEVGGDTKSAVKGAAAGALAFPAGFAAIASLPGIVIGGGIEKAGVGLSCVASNLFTEHFSDEHSGKLSAPAHRVAKPKPSGKNPN